MPRSLGEFQSTATTKHCRGAVEFCQYPRSKHFRMFALPVSYRSAPYSRTNLSSKAGFTIDRSRQFHCLDVLPFAKPGQADVLAF